MSNFLIFSLLSADPWGKDADLAYRQQIPLCIEEKRASPLTLLADALITFHQKVLSPTDGPRSHYIPSSSQYAADAIHKYGFFYGYLLGCDRIMRENDETWVYLPIQGELDVMKLDPVR